MTAQRSRYRPWAAQQIVPKALAVGGVGLHIDQHPAHTLWTQIEKAAGGRIALPAPAGTLARCRERAALLRAATLRGALRHWAQDGGPPREYVEGYPLPTVIATPSTPRDPKELADWAGAYRGGLLRALQDGAGMPFHSMRGIGSIFVVTDNDFLWERAFKLFDEAGDLVTMMLWAEEGYAVRADLDSWHNPHDEPLASILAREKSPGDWSDSFAALVLERNQAADWLRELAPHAVDQSRVTRFSDGESGRSAHRLQDLSDGRLNVDHELANLVRNGTPYVPRPWTRAQLAQYDQTPTLAWVSRPHSASYVDDAQKPLPLPMQSQVEQLAAAIQAAVSESHVPARILYDAGRGEGLSRRKAVLMQAVNAALPQLDLFDTRVGYDLRERLGDMGAASAVASLGLASMAVWETRAAVMVVSARRDSGAAVAVLSPTNAEYRDKFKRRPYEPA